MSEQPAQPYRLVYSKHIRLELIRFGKMATSPTILQAYLRDLQALDEHLRSDPASWGELAYRLPVLGLDVYRRAQEMLIAHYAIDEPRKTVYLSRVQPMTNRLQSDNP
jgi:hypothetical protein